MEPGQHRHRVRVVEQQRPRAELLHVLAELEVLLRGPQVAQALVHGDQIALRVSLADQVPDAGIEVKRAHEVGGVMHSYTGGAELVAVYRDLGFAFSFAGPVTYPNARRPIECPSLR